MIDYRDWYKSATGQRVTAETIGKLIGASRPTVTRRLTQDGLTADEIIKVSRGLRVNPVDALVDLGHITESEAMSHLDSDGALIATAEDGDLALELARRLNPATRADELDELAARRAGAPVSGPSASLPDDDDGIVREFDYEPGEYAADSSINEQEEREKRGEDPID